MPDPDRPNSPTPVWTLSALKYDGRLHYTLPAVLTHDDGDCLCFEAVVGSHIDHRTRGQQFPITRRSEMIFWRTRWYNVYVNYDAGGTLDHYYCNVGLPPQVDDHHLSFVDLDLDVRIWADGHHEVLDTDEFVEHSRQFGYPPDVRRAASEAVLDILLLWRSHRPPFTTAPAAPF